MPKSRTVLIGQAVEKDIALRITPNRITGIGTAVERDSAQAMTVLIRPHLWLHWAVIAIKHERAAWDIRNGYIEGSAYAVLLGLETDEALECVTAVRHCFNNLWPDWKERIARNANIKLEKQHQLRPHHFTNTSIDQGLWITRIKSVVDDRDYVVHHLEASKPTHPHGFYPTNVSELASLFTPERATEAVDVMLDDVLGPAIREPATALEGFVPERVLDRLLEQRAGGRNFYVS